MGGYLGAAVGAVVIGFVVVVVGIAMLFSGQCDLSFGEMAEPDLDDSYCFDFGDDSCVHALIEPVYAPVWLDDSSFLFYFAAQESSGGGTGGGGLYVRERRGKEYEIRRLTDPSGVDERFADDYSPSLGPDRTTVVYATFRLKTDGEHNFEIVSLSVDGETLNRLTESPLQETNPVVSPDGRHIAFLRSNTWSGEFRLMAMDSDGTDIQALAPEVIAWGTAPTWSPDSKGLAFVAWEPERSDLYTRRAGLYLVDLGSGGVKRLGDGWSQFAWSPDGQLLAFFGPHPMDPDVPSLYLVDPHGVEVRRLDGKWCDEFLWSPDGREVVCGGDGLSALDVETGEVRIIRAPDEPVQPVLGLAWAPESWILAVRVAPMKDPHPCGGVVLYTIHLNGSRFTPEVFECDGELTAASGGSISLLEGREEPGKVVTR